MDTNERLDVEDEDERRRRIETLLVRTDNAASSRNAPVTGPSPVFSVSAGHESPHPIDAPSDLLERVRHFLPQLADSNAALALQAPDTIDIENVGEDQEQYIEMNLGLGVFEYGKKDSDSQTSSSTSTTTSDSESESGSTASEDSTSADSESSTEISGTALPRTSRPTKPLPKRKRPEIVVIGETSTSANPHEGS